MSPSGSPRARGRTPRRAWHRRLATGRVATGPHPLDAGSGKMPGCGTGPLTSDRRGVDRGTALGGLWRRDHLLHLSVRAAPAPGYLSLMSGYSVAELETGAAGTARMLRATASSWPFYRGLRRSRRRGHRRRVGPGPTWTWRSGWPAGWWSGSASCCWSCRSPRRPGCPGLPASAGSTSAPLGWGCGHHR